MAYQRPDARRPRPSGGSERPNFSKSDRPAGPRTPGRPTGGGSGFRPDRGQGFGPKRDFRPGGGSGAGGSFRPGRPDGGFRPDRNGPARFDERGDRNARFDRNDRDSRGARDFRDERRLSFDQPDRSAKPPGKAVRSSNGIYVPKGEKGERNRKFVKPAVEPRPIQPAQYRDFRPARDERDSRDSRDSRSPRDERPGRFDADRPRAYDRREEPRTDRRDDRRDNQPTGRFGAKANGNRGFGSDRRDPRERQQAARARDDRREFGWQPDRTYRPATERGGNFDRNDRPHRPAGGERGPDRRFGQDRAQRFEAPNYNLQRFEKGAQNRARRVGSSNGDLAEPKEGIRLNRYIANSGVCSRREADELIAAGEIRVNGEVVTEMGYIVKPEDSVQYGKRSLKREKNVYVLLNKPKDYITTTEDPEERKTVMDLVGNASKERIFPVGRLDRNTTGLLLFTNDGELAQKLTHPSHRMQKIYQVELDKALSPDHFRQIQEGLMLEDGKVEVDDIAVVSGNERFVGVELHSGRNRIVRRIFEHLGYDIVTLDRVQYAGLTKKDLPRGNWRFLTQQEVIRLKFML